MKFLLLLLSCQSAVCYLSVPPRPYSYSRLSPSFSTEGVQRQPYNHRICTKSSSTCSEQALDESNNGRSVISRWYHKYLDLSSQRPYCTKAVSAGLTAGAGAILSQWIQAKSGGVHLAIDWHLVRSFTLTGLLFEGPYLHWWFDQLFKFGRFLGSKGVSSRISTIAQVAVDQTIGVAVFFPGYFFFYEIFQSLLVLRGKCWRGCLACRPDLLSRRCRADVLACSSPSVICGRYTHGN